MRRDAPGGKRQVKHIPEDLYRRYDEASYNVWARSHKMGLHIPKVSKNGGLECQDTPLFGFILGLAFGL